MKKIISLIAILAVLLMLLFTGNTYAVSLDTINIETSKTTVRPGEEVKLTVEFGQDLGAYTFNIAYDNNIFEYVSAEGGTPNDTTDKVIVVYHDSSGGTNPRTNMSVTFKAKDDITTSNPTEFTVTAEGLSNPDTSVTFDDITTPIVKNVTVEPKYIDYTLKLEHTGDIIKGKEKEMTLSYSSPMGHYYEHARLVAEATAPTGATVQLLATDESQAETDIIQSGWGDPQGYKIGGKDVVQELHVRGLFSEAGDYTIKLKLIDRDNSDQIITEKTFNFKALEETQTLPSEENKTEENPSEENIENEIKDEVKDETKQEQKPSKLPKTGNNIYTPIIIILAGLSGYIVYYNKRK